MSAAPFMQLYVADYLADTQHLTTEQHGAYLLLLMSMWRVGGSLPSDPKILARVAQVTPSRWHKIAPEVIPFFDEKDGRLTQKRLAKEHEKAILKSQLRKQIGALGGAAKALKDKEQALPKATDLPYHSSDIRYHKEEETPLPPKGGAVSLSDEKAKRLKEDEGWFDEAIRYDYPKKSPRLPALKAWMRLSKADKMACAHGVVSMSMRFDEHMKTAKRTKAEELKFLPDLSTFINQRRWELEKELDNETANG